MTDRPYSMFLKTVCAAALVVMVCAVAQAQSIRIKKRAEVAGGQVRLGDVAEISGVPAEDAEQFARVPVCASPLPGASKLIKADYLVARARQQGVPIDGMTIEGAGSVNVTSLAGNTLTSEFLVQQLEEYIRGEMPWSYDEAEILCHPAGRPLKLPAGEMQVVIRHQPAYTFVGEGVFPTVVYLDERRVRSLFLKAHVEVYKPVMVAREHIARGSALSGDRVAEQTVALSTLRGGYFLERDALAWLQARRDIVPGTVIAAEMVERPLLVRRGDDVMLKYKTSRIEVAVKMRARATGRLGDMIAVENRSSRKVLSAVVTGPGEVEIR